MFLGLIVTLAFDVGCTSPGEAGGALAASSAREFVERFVKAEFEGDEDRYERIRLSPEREKATRDLDPTVTGKVFQAVWSPFVAVRSFEIVEVKSSGATGRARIRYECLAESSGKGAVRDWPNLVCLSELRLIREGKSWFALDPPAAHVSIDRLIEAYREEMKLFTSDWAAHATETQLGWRNRIEVGLKELERIAAVKQAQ